MQMATWLLFFFQHVYFMIYIGLEVTVHENELTLTLVCLAHLFLSLAVFKYAYDVTKSDASHVS